MGEFIPDKPEVNPNMRYQAIGLKQAHLEDGLAGYQSGKSPDSYIGEILTMLREAGARRMDVITGMVDNRPAYKLSFEWGGVDVEITQVALPLKQKSPAKIEQSKKQALFHLFNEVRMELERRHFHPDMPAFVPYMIPPGQPDGQRLTFANLIAMANTLALPSPVEGEVVEP